MGTITSAMSGLAPRLIISAVIAGATILAPALTILETDGATTVSAHGSQSANGQYWSITGARTGAPSQREVSQYGGSHKHLWVERQLYGPGVVEVPRVDTSVHQSR